jgi:hypothetical protein
MIYLYRWNLTLRGLHSIQTHLTCSLTVPHYSLPDCIENTIKKIYKNITNGYIPSYSGVCQLYRYSHQVIPSKGDPVNVGLIWKNLEIRTAWKLDKDILEVTNSFS